MPAAFDRLVKKLSVKKGVHNKYALANAILGGTVKRPPKGK